MVANAEYQRMSEAQRAEQWVRAMMNLAILVADALEKCALGIAEDLRKLSVGAAEPPVPGVSSDSAAPLLKFGPGGDFTSEFSPSSVRSGDSVRPALQTNGAGAPAFPGRTFTPNRPANGNDVAAPISLFVRGMTLIKRALHKRLPRCGAW